jgi:hypothetical protein
MHVAYAAVLLLLLTVGCARVKPDTQVSEPAVVATQPGTPKPAAKPAAPATPQPAPAEAPAPSAKPPASGAASKAAPPVAKAPAVAPPLDLKTLAVRPGCRRQGASRKRLRRVLQGREQVSRLPE